MPVLLARLAIQSERKTEWRRGAKAPSARDMARKMADRIPRPEVRPAVVNLLRQHLLSGKWLDAKGVHDNRPGHRCRRSCEQGARFCSVHASPRLLDSSAPA